ncbi:hypothetical protein LF844_02190 [Metapseudomonas lalkuanensis]|uniref:hypothetical protein n=1 Tax=Metapseudomonas lalkuanensis TaxID=2604832 RepID=UPI001CF43F52|nr:hypothetical protein [Pseudomonas lalkuanensis]UCO98652.1 hypothetical protein LF844_02190 [Pseudomonas lalkuanensis]
MRVLMRFGGCFLLGLVISVLVLGTMMFAGAFGFIDLWLFTGKPLAGLALWLLPAGFWQGLTGVVDAAHNPAVRSFLELCAALGQGALVLAAGFFRLWYRHAGGVE